MTPNNWLFLYILFITVYLSLIVLIQIVAIRERVKVRFPGFSPYLNPIGIYKLWRLNTWINATHKSRVDKSWSDSPKREWFPKCIRFEDSSDENGYFSSPGRDYVNTIHPTLLGYDWYRGYHLKFEEYEVLIFTPWVWPQKTRPTLFLFKGKVPTQNIVSAYLTEVRENKA